MDRSKAIKVLTDVFGNFKKQSSEMLFFCPACNHQKQKLSINLDLNAFKCWVCDYKGKSIRRAIRRFGNFSNLKEWDRIFGAPDLSQFDFLFSEEQKVEEKLELPPGFRSLVRDKMTIHDLEPYNYLVSRGLSKRDIGRWKIGYCSFGPYKNRIVFPSFNEEGNLNYFVGRAYKDAEYKYKNPRTSKNIIFNELFIDWSSDLVLVEGVFDAVISGNAVPILGSTITKNSKLLQKIVLNDTPVYLALDADAFKKQNEIIKLLLRYDIELFKIDTNGIEDIGSITKQEFLERKSKATRIESTDYLLLDLLSKIK